MFKKKKRYIYLTVLDTDNQNSMVLFWKQPSQLGYVMANGIMVVRGWGDICKEQRLYSKTGSQRLQKGPGSFCYNNFALEELTRISQNHLIRSKTITP